MPVKWKASRRFKPSVILKKIDGVRTISGDGSVSFSGMDIDDYQPTLESLIEFPPVAVDLETSTLVWKALGKAPAPLTPENFMSELNRELNDLLRTRESTYVLLTSLSINFADIPKSLTTRDSEIQFWLNDYPSKFRQSRAELLEQTKIQVEETPQSYCKVSVKVKAKSASSALHKAMKALDVQRGIWCLMANPVMQLSFGRSALRPINVVRLGSKHTLHLLDGAAAVDQIWYEPSFQPTAVLKLKSPKIAAKNLRVSIRRMEKSNFGGRLRSSIVRYVRALDESNANTSFLQLWGALESLASPDVANYDDVIKRCSFLWEDHEYHRQVLEHLRAYRNANVHEGEESDKARTHCYQLQSYYQGMFWFLIRNAEFFKTLAEANQYLDLPQDVVSLKRQLELVRKAIKFVSG